MNEITKELLEACKAFTAIQHIDSAACGPLKSALLMAKKAIAKAEAALAEPQADEDGWIPWSGGECLVYAGVRVEVLLRNGKKRQEEPGWLFWSHGQLDGDIIAYRIAKGADK